MLDTTLAQVRRLAQPYLSGSYELLNATRAFDSYGRETITYAVAATVRGQLSSASGSERELLSTLVDSGVERLETARLALPWGTTVTAGQFVRKTGSTKAWNIRHVAADDEDLGAYVVALLTRETAANE